jgi:hypothetical protein
LLRCSNAATELKAITKVITDDLTRVGISNERQVTKALDGSDVSDIAYPDLVRSGRFKVLDDVMMLIESVQRISGSRAVFFSKG